MTHARHNKSLEGVLSALADVLPSGRNLLIVAGVVAFSLVGFFAIGKASSAMRAALDAKNTRNSAECPALTGK